MADTKVSALTAATSVATTDILPVVTDPGSSPASKKITVDNFQKSLGVVGKVTVTQPATAATLTLADNSTLATVGAYATTLTATNTTGVTLPTTGTLATLAGGETLSGKTLTAPKLVDGGFIADANGNELIIGKTTASAVNEVTVTNAATTAHPKIAASGETNVSLDMGGKGTGTVNLVTPLTFDENTGYVMNAALSADGKYDGITVAGTAGATLAFGDLVYFASADSRWELTDANVSAGYDKLLGICVLAAANDGDATKILLLGTVRADTAFPDLTIGAPAYMSETAGDVVVAQPTTTDAAIRIVGFGVTKDILFFKPSNDYITHT